MSRVDAPSKPSSAMTSTAARMIAALPGRRVTGHEGNVPETEQPLSFAPWLTLTLGDLFAIDVVDIRGVPTKVFRNAPPSLRAIWELSAAFAATTTTSSTATSASRSRTRTATCARWRAGCASKACSQGDRVAIATRNYPEWVVAFWATQAIGAVVVPLNAWWTGPELAYGLADSGAVVLFADDERAERVAPHLAETPVRATVLIRADATSRRRAVGRRRRG